MASARSLTLRAKLVLACAEAAVNSVVAERHGVTPATVGKWRPRFIERRITALHDELRPGQPRTVDDERLATLINTMQPRDGSTHWTIRGVAAETGISKTSVHRYLQMFGVAPHRSESFKLSTDPFFIEKGREVVGLYLDPSDNALVLRVDEKSQVQALERTQPLLRASVRRQLPQSLNPCRSVYAGSRWNTMRFVLATYRRRLRPQAIGSVAKL